jgi:hypothetical protein
VKFGYDLMSRFAAQYRVVVEVLLAAQDTSLTGMSLDDISAAVFNLDCRRRSKGTSRSTPRSTQRR